MSHNQHTTSTRRRDKGFTLVEILIAIVVVGILAAVAILVCVLCARTKP
jgi:prepilin-type N-terminal cleavage/methylation domain-containing protein